MSPETAVPDSPRSLEHRTRIGAATAIGLAAIWAWADVPRIDHPMGSDWAQYFTVAEIIWHDDPHLYPVFRKPFFGLLLGLVGEHVGYFEAAQFFGRLSAMAMVVAAGIGAWALVGPLAGAVAAGVVVGMPLVMDGALWVNNYPLLGAATGMGLAAGAALSRWPRWYWAVLAGSCAGVAAALDVRGVVVAPIVLALLLLGLPWGAWRRVAVLVLAFALPLGAINAYEGWLNRTFDIPQLTLDSQLRVQRQAVIEPIVAGTMEDAELEAACAGATLGTSDSDRFVPYVDALDSSGSGACASVLRKRSFDRLTAVRAVPDLRTLCLFPLVLLPMAWRRRDPSDRLDLARSAVASFLVLGLPLVLVFVGMGWVHYYDRYVLPFGAMIAVLVPVAWGRLAGFVRLWNPTARGAMFIAGAVSLAWAGWVWPGFDARDLEQPETIRRADYAAGIMAQWARDNVADTDKVVDCGGLAVDYLLLPRRIDYDRYPPGDPICDQWIRAPGSRPGQTFLITMDADVSTQSGAVPLSFQPAAIGALDWTPLETPGDLVRYRLWSLNPER